MSPCPGLRLYSWRSNMHGQVTAWILPRGTACRFCPFSRTRNTAWWSCLPPLPTDKVGTVTIPGEGPSRCQLANRAGSAHRDRQWRGKGGQAGQHSPPLGHAAPVLLSSSRGGVEMSPLLWVTLGPCVPGSTAAPVGLCSSWTQRKSSSML